MGVSRGCWQGQGAFDRSQGASSSARKNWTGLLLEEEQAQSSRLRRKMGAVKVEAMPGQLGLPA